MLFVMMLLGSADVLGRYLFSKPITGVYEIFEILLPGIVLLCLAGTQLAGGHITVGLISYAHITPQTQARIDFVVKFLLFCLFGLITWQGIDTAIIHWQQHRLVPNIRVPMFLPQLLLPLGALAICPVLILQMLRSLARMKKER